MITIDLLRNHPDIIPQLAKLWWHGFGRIWQPDISADEVQSFYDSEMQSEGLPITFVAFDEGRLIGMCSLSANDGIRPDLTPWLASAFVDEAYRGTGVGGQLVRAVCNQARALGLPNLYLFVFEPSLSDYYARFGFLPIATDTYGGYSVIVMQATLASDTHHT